VTNDVLAPRLAKKRYDIGIKLGLSLVLIAIVAWLIAGFARDITSRTNKVMAHIEMIAKGDFTADIRVAGNDELSRIGSSSNVLVTQLSNTFRDIRQSAGALLNASMEIATTSAKVAQSAASQSSSADTMASAVEEMTASIAQMSNNASTAYEVTNSSGRTAVEGGHVIDATVELIRGIAETVRGASDNVANLGKQASEISGIVTVIKEIAEQTNLLALNAAIESARAGETGRGFAVVADEVRKLAERTSASTQQISSMIGGIQSGASGAVSHMEASVKQVEEGVTLAGNAGRAISDIRDTSNQVVQAVSSITTSLIEQSTATSEVAKKVENIAKMSEETSKAAKSSAHTAEELRAMAATLDQQLNRFKLAR